MHVQGDRFPQDSTGGGGSDAPEADGGESLQLDCPACGEVQDHEVLRQADAGWTVRCQECRRVRTVPAPRRERGILLPVVLSEGASARTLKVEVPLDGPVAVDEETHIDGRRVRITAVELRDGARPKSALGRDIRTVYAVVYDTVRLRYTVNQGDVTRSFTEEVAPEDEVHIGLVREVQGVLLAVKTLKSDQNRTLHRGFLLARNVRRIFADLAPGGSKAGKPVKVRKRGAPPGASKPRSKDRRPGPMRPRRA